MKWCATLLSLALLSACDREEQQTPDATKSSPAASRDQVAAAFEWLELDGRDGAFAILEDPDTADYVQFGLMGEEWIHFDVPVFVCAPENLEAEDEWEEVESLPELDAIPITRFMTESRESDVWKLIEARNHEPYRHRLIYREMGEVVATSEAICVNLPRKDLMECARLARALFEAAYGRDFPSVVDLTTGQTGWTD